MLTILCRQEVWNVHISIHRLGPQAAAGEAGFQPLPVADGDVPLPETGAFDDWADWRVRGSAHKL